MSDKEKEALLLLAGWRKIEKCIFSLEDEVVACWLSAEYRNASDTDGNIPHYVFNEAFKRMTNDDE